MARFNYSILFYSKSKFRNYLFHYSWLNHLKTSSILFNYIDKQDFVFTKICSLQYYLV